MGPFYGESCSPCAVSTDYRSVSLTLWQKRRLGPCIASSCTRGLMASLGGRPFLLRGSRLQLEAWLCHFLQSPRLAFLLAWPAFGWCAERLSSRAKSGPDAFRCRASGRIPLGLVSQRRSYRSPHIDRRRSPAPPWGFGRLGGLAPKDRPVYNAAPDGWFPQLETGPDTQTHWT